MSKKIIIVSGPTGSGKSRLCNAIYSSIPSIIINADALQVYDELPILTAKPRDSNNAEKYRLYNIFPSDKGSSVAEWLELAEKEIKNALSNNLMPIIVGGTGLYIKALLYGLSKIPSIDPSVTDYIKKRFASCGREEFFKWICEKDPKIKKRIHVQDTYRLLRAASVFEQTGNSIYSYERRLESKYDNLHIYLEPDRDILYRWCNDRFEEMLEKGVLAEVQEFMKKKDITQKYAIEKALGYKQLEQHLKDEISLNEAIEIAQRVTRNYAKRQYTWFRHQTQDKHSIKYRDYSDIEKVVMDKILEFVAI